MRKAALAYLKKVTRPARWKARTGVGRKSAQGCLQTSEPNSSQKERKETESFEEKESHSNIGNVDLGTDDGSSQPYKGEAPKKVNHS